MLSNVQVPQSIEALPNSQQRIADPMRRRQRLRKRIAPNQCRIRMQKRKESRCHRRKKNTHPNTHRQRDLPVRPAGNLPQHFQIVAEAIPSQFREDS